MQRVMIVGGPGSGKSSLARELGAVTGLPVFHMDHIHWKPGWVERPPEEKDRLVREVHAREAWILEGGHSRTYAERVARADTLVWLDFPVALRLWRVLRRTIRHHGRSRPDLPEGCPEGFNRNTLRFWAFVWRNSRIGRERIARIVRDRPAHLAVHRLASLREIRRFLAACGPDG